MAMGLSALFWGIVTFSVLVVIHEAGHFLAARAFGVKVHEFMVGLPGPAIRIHGKKTTYGVTAVPLGGYVRIAGMEPGPEDPMLGPALAAITRRGECDDAQLAADLGISMEDAGKLITVLSDWDAVDVVSEDSVRSRFESGRADDVSSLLADARRSTYRALSLWQRIVVLTAGVVLNLVTAVLVFTVLFSVVPYGRETGLISDVAKGSAAEKAGLLPGDRITSVNGVAVKNFQELVLTVARFKAGETVMVVAERDGKTMTFKARLGRNAQTHRGLLGVSPEVVVARANPWQALKMSFEYLWLTVVAIAGLMNPSTFAATTSLSSSVIGASVMAAGAVREGLVSYVGLIAALSLSLGAINIVPLPPLDGGKVAIELFEHARGKQLSRRFNVGLSLGGAALLFTLVGYLMYVDVQRIVGG